MSQSEIDNLYFDLQADFGITKHMGGFKATRELAELCHIGENSHLLLVGCGIGHSLIYIARHFGCRITSIDISEKMVLRSLERVKRYGLEKQVEIKVGDAQNIPCKDNLFDAVICESVTAFVLDKRKAVNEYQRVAKPGGYIGLNEVAWIKEPTQELKAYAAQIMAGADFLTYAGWQQLLQDSGLKNIEIRPYKFNAGSQYLAEIQQLSIPDIARAWGRFISQSFTNPAYRKFIKSIMSKPGLIFQFTKHIGYGLYVGRKPKVQDSIPNYFIK